MRSLASVVTAGNYNKQVTNTIDFLRVNHTIGNVVENSDLIDFGALEDNSLREVNRAFKSHTYGTHQAKGKYSTYRKARSAPTHVPRWRVAATRYRERKGLPTQITGLNSGRRGGSWLYCELEQRWEQMSSERIAWFEAQQRPRRKWLFISQLLNGLSLFVTLAIPTSSIWLIALQFCVSAWALSLMFRTNFGWAPRSVQGVSEYLAVHDSRHHLVVATLTGHGLVSPEDERLDMKHLLAEDGSWMLRAYAGFVASGGFDGLPAYWLMNRGEQELEDLERLGSGSWLSEQGLDDTTNDTFWRLMPGFEGSLRDLVIVARALS